MKNEVKEQLTKIRKRVSEFLLENNTVDRLMREKVEDYILIQEQPLPVNIGVGIKEQPIFIGNFTNKNNDTFWEGYGKIMGLMGAKLVNFELLKDGMELAKVLRVNKIIKKALIKLLHKTVIKQQAYWLNENSVREKIQWKNHSLRWFRNNVSDEQIMQLCFLVYLFNFGAEKKNLSLLLNKMDPAGKEAMENFIYNWLENCHGLTGNFIQSQLIKPASLSSDSPKEVIGIGKKAKGNLVKGETNEKKKAKKKSSTVKKTNKTK